MVNISKNERNFSFSYAKSMVEEILQITTDYNHVFK